MNIGFVEASKLFPELNCLMFHDADSLLEDDRLLMRCDSRPHHYAYYLDRWNYKYLFIHFYRQHGLNMRGPVTPSAPSGENTRRAKRFMLGE